MAELLVYQAQCEYYFRQKLYHSVRMTATEALEKFPDKAAEFRLWQAMGTSLEGRWQDALRQLDRTTRSTDFENFQLVVTLLQLYCHQLCDLPDKQAISLLRERVKKLRRNNSATELQYAGVFMMSTGFLDKAREYLDRAVKREPALASVWVMRAWLEVLAVVNISEAERFLDEASVRDERNWSMIQCRARCYLLHNNFPAAHDQLNRLLLMHPSFVPALVEKMRVCMAQHDWTQGCELAERALSLAPHCVEAMLVKLVNVLIREGDTQLACQYIEDLRSSVELYEPYNVQFLLVCVRVISRICDRHPAVLNGAMSLCRAAVKLDPRRADVHTEMGRLYVMLRDTTEALLCFRTASTVEESSSDVLIGVAWCQLYDFQLDSARHSLEFLLETMKGTNAASVTLEYDSRSDIHSHVLVLLAMLGSRENMQLGEVIEHISSFVDSHFRSFRALTLGVEYLTALNPDLLLMAVEVCLNLSRSLSSASPTLLPLQQHDQWSMNTDHVSPFKNSLVISQLCQQSLQLASTILEPLIKTCPAISRANYMMARTKYLLGERRLAIDILRKYVEGRAASCETHLLLVQILLDSGLYGQAEQTLEQGLSHDFNIKHQPLYHLLRARIEKKQQRWPEAISYLHTALTLCGIKKPAGSNSGSGVLLNQIAKTSSSYVDPVDLLSVFIELAHVHRLNSQMMLARETLDQAAIRFSTDPRQRQCVLVAAADLKLADGDIQGALSALRAINAEQPLYVESRIKMAGIYLKHLVDRRMYASYYCEILEKHPSISAYIMLGDAYVNILEPDKAIEVYESVLKRSPRDQQLTLKMGRALVKTHHYSRAVSYYKDAIRSATASASNDDNNVSNCVSLLYDLAFLLVRMRQYEKADKIAQQALDKLASLDHQHQIDSFIDRGLNMKMMSARLLYLLSRINMIISGKLAALDTLRRAFDEQSRVLTLARAQKADIDGEHRRRTAQVACSLADGLQKDGYFERAIELYRQAAHLDDEDDQSVDESGALMSLTLLLEQLDRIDECRQTCEQLLKKRPQHMPATLMVASLCVRQNNFDQAVYYYRQLLQHQPECWTALAALLRLLRYCGKLSEGRTLLNGRQAELQQQSSAGLAYCRGMYFYYANDVDAAINSLNLARGDTEWGFSAVERIITICLERYMSSIGDQLLGIFSHSGDPDNLDPLSIAVKMLPELCSTQSDKEVGNLSHRLLSNWCLLATKSKAKVEQALQDFVDVISLEVLKHRHVDAVFGVASAHVLLKQIPRARSLLQKVVDGEYSHDFCEYTEWCIVLLADLNIHAGKHAPAIDLLLRVLRHNKSCRRALQRLALIKERDNSYTAAAGHLQHVWVVDGLKCDPAIGYKLAYNYLKSKRYVQAIKVSLHVLKDHPQYPKIRKEILEEARSQLKV